MKDSITEALGLPDIVPDFQFNTVRQRILQDNLVYNSVLAALVEQHAPAVIAAMHPLSKKRLRDKLGYPDANTPANHTSWSIQEVTRTGQPYVQVTCSRCNHTERFAAPRPWIEHKEDSRGTWDIPHPVTREAVEHALAGLVFVHCGRSEKCPPQFLEMARAEFTKAVQS